MKLRKKNLLILFALLLFNFTVLINPAESSTFEQINANFHKTGTAAGFPITSDGKPEQEFGLAWIKYVNGMVTVMGLLFMIMMIYSGWLWLTAHGKEEQVTKAKNMLMQAVIGIAIILVARIMVELVITLLGQKVP